MFLRDVVDEKHPANNLGNTQPPGVARQLFTIRILDEEDLFPTRGKPLPMSPRAPASPRVEQRDTNPIPADDEVAKLKDQLAKAESQIQQLKLEKLVGKGPGEGHELHAKPLGPTMMPGPHSILPIHQLGLTVLRREKHKTCPRRENVLSSGIIQNRQTMFQ